MKLIQKLTKGDLKDIKLLCFDCDGVTIKEGTVIRENQGELVVRTSKLSPKVANELNQLKDNFLIMFSSGRHPLYLSRMYEQVLWDKVILQGENGILSLYNGKIEQTSNYPLRLLKIATEIKEDLRKLKKTNKIIEGFEPKQFLISIHCQRELEKVKRVVKKHDINNEFYCLWSGEAYDIGPKIFNKGIGLKNLVKKLNLNMENVLAVGNDPNDKEMVEWAGISVTTDPDSVIKGADFITKKHGVDGGEEVISKILELI